MRPVGGKPARAKGFAALAAVASAPRLRLFHLNWIQFSPELFAESSKAQRIITPASTTRFQWLTGPQTTCGDRPRASNSMKSLPRRLFQRVKEIKNDKDIEAPRPGLLPREEGPEALPVEADGLLFPPHLATRWSLSGHSSHLSHLQSDLLSVT